MNPFHIVRAALPLFGLLITASAAAATAQDNADEDAQTLEIMTAEDATEEPDEMKPPEPSCIQVIVYAYNPQTGECREFPTPCDVPPGWKISYTPICELSRPRS